MTNIVDDIAQHIRIVDGGNRLTPGELGAALANHLVQRCGPFIIFAADVVEFVERTNPDKKLGAGHLAELIVAEFDLDKG